MGIATLLYTFFRGSHVGTDAAGNRYFIERRPRAAGAEPRRWVVFCRPATAGSVPAGWDAWLHFSKQAATAGGADESGERRG